MKFDRPYGLAAPLRPTPPLELAQRQARHLTSELAWWQGRVYLALCAAALAGELRGRKSSDSRLNSHEYRGTG